MKHHLFSSIFTCQNNETQQINHSSRNVIENELATSFIALTRQTILNDFRLVCESRQASLLGRKDVMGGRAKFGIFGDGKELAQVAMAKVFRKGDFRSGYYRDQTVVAALENLELEGRVAI